jgi:hypothetical protein
MDRERDKQTIQKDRRTDTQRTERRKEGADRKRENQTGR